VYNGAATVGELVQRLGVVLAEIGLPHEVILVNDGSQDASWATIVAAAEREPWVRGINLARNYGQHNALLCAVRAARFDVCVTLDDDLQHPPEEIPQLLAKLAEGFDVVYGTPRQLTQNSARNFLSEAVKRAMARAIGLETIRDINAFRVFRTRLRDAFADFRSPQLLLDALLVWGTRRFAAVPVRHERRRVGRSNYTLRRLFNQTLFMLTGFSTAPLRMASLVGFGFFCFGVLVLIYVLARFLVEGSQPGFPFLASIIALFSGAQLFALGILGEYLARIFDRSAERPTYLVHDQIPPTPAP